MIFIFLIFSVCYRLEFMWNNMLRMRYFRCCGIGTDDFRIYMYVAVAVTFFQEDNLLLSAVIISLKKYIDILALRNLEGI